MHKNNVRYNLKTRLFATISLLILFAVATVSTFSIYQFRKTTIEQSNTQTKQLIKQLSLYTGDYISELSRLCHSPLYSERIMKTLELECKSTSDILNKKREIEDFLKELMTIPRGDILRVSIFSDDGIYSSSKTDKTAFYSSNYKNESWYNDALAYPQTIFLPSHEEKHGGYTLTFFSMILRLQSLSDSNKSVGVIRVDANYNGIRDVLDSVNINDGSILLIADNSHNLIYSNKAANNLELNEIVASALNKANLIKINNETFYLNSEAINGTDWTIIVGNSASVLLKSINSVTILSVILAVVCVVMVLIISGLFTRSFTQPINETVDVMKLAQKGDLSARAPESKANEINFLNKSFNEMLQNLSDTLARNTRLTKEMFEAKYLQKKAQYDMLHNQIRPHFLFNTLSTISLLVKCGKAKEAVQCIDELSILLRGMVNSDKEIPLSSEVKILESYLSLQSRRHDSLKYNITVEDSVSDCYIPALTLQPIVENAVIHGCEQTIKDILIIISIVSIKDMISISISDTGVGISEENLNEIKKRIAESEKTEVTDTKGIGLVNCYQRLHLKYGDSLKFTIDSIVGNGTTISILIPSDRKEDTLNER